MPSSELHCVVLGSLFGSEEPSKIPTASWFPVEIIRCPKTKQLETLPNQCHHSQICLSFQLVYLGHSLQRYVAHGSLSHFGLLVLSRGPLRDPRSVLFPLETFWDPKTNQLGTFSYQFPNSHICLHPSWVQLEHSLQNRVYPRHSLQSGVCLKPAKSGILFFIV